MNTNRVADASHHLLTRFGGYDRAEEEARRKLPPDAAVLIQRVIKAAASPQPTADSADLRCALALVASDRWAADSREINLVELARRRGMSWRDIGWSLGLDSAQAAQKRFQKLTQEPEILVYAFRLAGEKDAAWHGKPDLLRNGRFESGTLDFNPARPGPFRGRTLEFRYGPVHEECPPPYMRAYALLNNRRVALTTALQNELFTG